MSLKSALKNYLLRKKAYKFFIKDWSALTDLNAAADVMGTLRFSCNLRPIVMPAPQAKRALVIAPHPDDEIFGPGGVVLQLLAQGCQVDVVYLTTGKQKTAVAQRQEAEAIARELGYTPHFLGHFAKALPIDAQAIQHFAATITACQSDVLFVPFLLDDHDDHRRASHMLLLAQQQNLLQLNCDVWAYQVYTTLPCNVMVDITVVAEQKIAAIRLWESQAKVRNWAHYIMGLNAFNTRFMPGATGQQYAENFFVLPFKEYMRLCERYFLPNAENCYYNPAYLAAAN